MCEIDNHRTILDIVGRLHIAVQNRWKKKTLKYRKSTGLYLKFEDLCEFVSDVAYDEYSPVYGNSTAKSKTTSCQHKYHSVCTRICIADAQRFSGNACGASADAQGTARGYWLHACSEAPCLLCGVSHHLFRKLSPEKQLKMVETNKLCHNCLLSSHDTSTCVKKSAGSVQGCGKNTPCTAMLINRKLRWMLMSKCLTLALGMLSVCLLSRFFSMGRS